MHIKTFMSIWIMSILAISIFGLTLARNQISTMESKPAHFSVVWKGFAPSYSNSTPDYYVCINNMLSPLQMNIAFQIQNFENDSYYFKIDKYGTPPTGWNIVASLLGPINVDETQTFIFTSITRDKPSTIPEGRLTENVPLVVQAYRDGACTDLYSQENFTVPFHFIDLTSEEWTTLMYNNFDDGTLQGWSVQASGIVNYTIYRSWPGAARGYLFDPSGYRMTKSIDTSGPYTEAYLVFAYQPDDASEMIIKFDGQTQFQSDQSSAAGTWYQIAVPLPLYASTSVAITSVNYVTYAYFDDIYVIAKW